MIYPSEAIRLVKIAIEEGKLRRPDTCELCGDKPGLTIDGRTKIFGHHWNGYDNPLDVWFVCVRCNNVLKGKEYHNGSISKSQAKEIIKPKNKPIKYQCRGITHKGKRCTRNILGREYCTVHDSDKLNRCEYITLNGDRCMNKVERFYRRYCSSHLRMIENPHKYYIG